MTIVHFQSTTMLTDAAAGNDDTLALTALSSSDSDFTAPFDSTAGVRVNTNGDVEELSSGGSWIAQNSGTEWIDGFTTSSASDYEVQLTKSTGTDPTSGPTLATYHTISSIRTWQWASTIEESYTFTGTMTIREIANTANSVSASVTISITNEAA